jgi:hypothetical protein
MPIAVEGFMPIAVFPFCSFTVFHAWRLRPEGFFPRLLEGVEINKGR